jgi:hypothetical protein
MRVFSRSSSFLSLTAPIPLSKQRSQPAHEEDNTSTAYSWTFAPFARELTRTAGGFEHRAKWPLSNGSTLLDLHLDSTSARSTGFSFASAYARRYSSLPHNDQTVQPQQSQFSSSAGVIELPEQLQQPTPGVLASWLPKAQPRLKGLGRKLFLRQVNRKIIARVARRLTIGIPVLGEYLAVRLPVLLACSINQSMLHL